MTRQPLLPRRAFLGGALGLGAAGLFPVWAQSGSPGLRADLPSLSGDDIRLTVGHSAFTVGGRTGHAITVNGTLPAPLVRLREGQNVRLHVTNTLDEDTSIHWHGLLLPFQMDGVPGISFPGIRPRETFTYEFPVRQSGTYWYHSHSGLQEQSGHYGPIVIDPAGVDPVGYDREHVIVLSDWSFLHPHQIMAKLWQEGGYFNRNRMTLAGRASGRRDQQMSAADRAMWANMRMDPTDILDVNGTTYTYLINGHGPDENWTGLFNPGERVRLRIINASAMTIFNVRIPGLPMRVVAADGIDVRPVTVDEFQISVAETYDVIVQPNGPEAYTFVAEAMDRSGFGRATLAPRLGMSAAVPPLRERPVLTMTDMGMGGMDHAAMGHGTGGDAAGQAPAMSHDMRDGANAPQVDLNPGVDMIAPMPKDRTGEPGLGLENVGHRVLTYRDLMAVAPNSDTRAPTRTVEVHLTGNMERFMWSFDGRRFSENPEPLRFERNERVRVRLINDTMMAHPIHIHGHFFELVNGHTGFHPHKHTVNVLPGGTVDFDLTADAPGDWAFHCHLLFHMHAGMMRTVTVRPLDGGAA
ncbi:copper resistance system multicopper oxidase [Sphingosinicella sp. LHD-64]|uniref:copper resistance system multicopper oxidase n=1 Tax=Sphingosinicella sp. LHD-64 TaxID=3072139 RepID=UPI00280F028F|nr:copper resistance system multicopper oxidase [Sphingosinicella sp. LHD-64]MDQ8756760.1 copper resistance system multicopper oxidase [Sphingosinicella sp. LHD-64]